MGSTILLFLEGLNDDAQYVLQKIKNRAPRVWLVVRRIANAALVRAAAQHT
jgi:hypothetical protein